MTASSGGQAELKAKWPGVTFDDEMPRKGFFKITLEIPELTVNKGVFGLTKATPKNAEIKPEFTASSVKFIITVRNREGANITYEYNKPLPEDIDPDRCDYKVKSSFVVIILCKKSSLSWTQYSQYLMRKEQKEDK